MVSELCAVLACLQQSNSQARKLEVRLQDTCQNRSNCRPDTQAFVLLDAAGVEQHSDMQLHA